MAQKIKQTKAELLARIAELEKKLNCQHPKVSRLINAKTLDTIVEPTCMDCGEKMDW